MFFDQQEFDIRCEWGEHGVAALAAISSVVIIVERTWQPEANELQGKHIGRI